jgi:hydrogenase nickel incorporation protein HypB
MCESCGCSDGAKTSLTNMRTGARIEIGPDHAAAPHRAHDHRHAHGASHHHGAEHDHAHTHTHTDNHDHGHGHSHSHDHHHHDHDHGHGHAHDHPHSHTVALGQAVLQKNDALAARNRAWFAGREILALNLVSSPGAGKTTLLERTIRDLGQQHAFYVIEGDQATANDGARIEAAGAPAVQVNTGTGCHLEADMVARALQELAPAFGSVVMIENVGNLVCPALFDLGERAKVAIISVTEGEDKAVKYPHMFQASSLVLVNKIDLLPHLSFDVARCIANIRQVNPRVGILQLSATTGEGLDQWYGWIVAESRAARLGAIV